MSHFTKVKTKINDLEALRRGLDALGYPYEVGGRVRAWDKTEVDAAIKINLPGAYYEIGVVPEADGYALTADWSMLGIGRTQDEIVNGINRAYSVAKVTMECEAAGYSFEGAPEVQADGSIVLNAVQWS